MNSNPPLTAHPPAAASTARLASGDRAWVGDWNRFVIVHFAVPAEVLAPHVPYPLDLQDDLAWVSLVWFELERLRFAGTGWLGRWLCRPISEHPFLTVRTYVRGADGPGICFLAEWIPNRLSVRLGPPTYGLPYRYGRFTAARDAENGTAMLRIDDPGHDAPLGLTVPSTPPGGTLLPEGTIDAFLLERYQAYTFDAARRMRFRVAHAPWRAHRATWVRFEAGFLNRVFPWFTTARLHSAHLCADCPNVEMGRPHRVSVAASVGNARHPIADPVGRLPAHA